MGAKRLIRWTTVLVAGLMIGVALSELRRTTTTGDGPTPVLIGTVDDSLLGTLINPAGAFVSSIVDGDTLRLSNGRRVRLLQIDAPERDECFTRAATSALARLLPRDSQPEFSYEKRFGYQDEYGRLLLYVEMDDRLVNVELVRQGAAVPYFFRGQRGIYADKLLAAAKEARRNRRGLWGACAGAKLDPRRGALTGPA